MRLFVINLDRQPERFKRMSAIFGNLGLQLDRVSAVDGATLSVDDLIRLRDNAKARPGETACFLSHRECWRRIVDEKLPYAAIFEDDLHMGDGAASVLSEGDWIPADADIVKIETMNRPVKIDKSPAGLVGDRKIHRLRGSHTGGGAYILTRKGAKKLLETSELFDNPVDHFMFNFELPWVRSLEIFQLSPAVCIQDFVLDKQASSFIGLGSDLHHERTTKPKGLAKAWREIKRPFIQLFSFIRRTAFNLLTDKRWAIVPFR
ncbi:glycosyltransferase family 25 protein [Mesorhizobium sp. SB112]|uniref:glycosyltransferase family 25 protein n=1 Tax=Mesorhizobium sp. SB112 TaxID=3151853 RepID=UPI003262D025